MAGGTPDRRVSMAKQVGGAGMPRWGATLPGRHLTVNRSRIGGSRSDLSETVTLRPTSTGSRTENTTKMSPDDEHRFVPHKVECLLKDILDAKLHNMKYDADNCSRLAKDICSMIKDKTKEFEFSRYKLVTQVLLGQDSDESIQIASRCLWNHETDNFAAATYRNNALYAVAIVYGMYLD